MKLFWAYPNHLENVINLSILELEKHANISLDNGCGCLENLYKRYPIKFGDLCFCCKCLVFLKYKDYIMLYNYNEEKIDLFYYLGTNAMKGI